MLTTLQTLVFLFGMAFVLGFFSHDIKAILNPPKPASEGASTGTPDVKPVEQIAPPPAIPK